MNNCKECPLCPIYSTILPRLISNNLLNNQGNNLYEFSRRPYILSFAFFFCIFKLAYNLTIPPHEVFVNLMRQSACNCSMTRAPLLAPIKGWLEHLTSIHWLCTLWKVWTFKILVMPIEWTIILKRHSSTEQHVDIRFKEFFFEFVVKSIN